MEGGFLSLHAPKSKQTWPPILEMYISRNRCKYRANRLDSVRDLWLYRC